jgi:hypothetical protein
MNEVTIVKRRRSWEWQVHDRSGKLIMSGRERSRPAARYQGYRALFMLLSVGRRSAPKSPIAAVKQRETNRLKGSSRRYRDLTAASRQASDARDSNQFGPTENGPTAMT